MIITQKCQPQLSRSSSVRTVTGTVEKPETIRIKELTFGAFSSFPDVGEDERLYIATDQNAIYRYDVTAGQYVQLSGGDGETIDTITVINSTLQGGI